MKFKNKKSTSNQTKLKNSEIASFCSQMSLLLQAGIMPRESMMIMITDTEDESGRLILEQILQACIDGDQFHKALDATGVFPNYVITMVSIGESSGCLDIVMQTLANFYEREDNFSDEIRNAITYPLIMVFMMSLVILVLLTKILPIFEQVFSQLGSELTGISLSLMLFGKKIEKFSVVIIGILFILAIFTIFITHTKRGKKLYKKIISKIPILHSFQDKLACERFASGMALLLSSGIDISQSLFLVNELVDNPRMQEKISLCRNYLENGYNLSESLSKAHIFNNLYSRMVSVGFKSGNLPVVMDKIADCYENETSKKLSNFVSVLEPTLVIILSFIIGIILISVILPLMSVMSSLGN